MIDHRAGKHTYKVYKCKELLQQALAIDVKDNSTATHPECVCKPCKLTIVHARVPKKHTIAFQGYAHKAEGCKVRNKVQTNGTVSTKIAPRLECYKNASRLNRYNFPTDNAIDFLFSTLQ